MKYHTVTVREGEKVGPIDWAYNFGGHAWGPGRGGANPELVAANTELLRTLEESLASGERWEATTDGGWPRVGWKRVLDVGMYDGWPYWRPVPSVRIAGTLGPEWHSFTSITEARRLP